MLHRQILLVLGFLHVGYSTCKGVVVSKPSTDYCHGLDCPKYDVVEKNDDYEVRKYPSYMWAAARETGLDYSDATRKNFMKLFRYIQGNNVDKQKIEMTAPVLNSLIVSQGPFCEADFTTHFFVPYKFQGTPPKPMNDTDQVFIMRTPESTVYVRSYGGFSNEDKLRENAVALVTALQKKGIKFDPKHYFAAGYDSPYRLLNRHNEVMFVAQD